MPSFEYPIYLLIILILLKNSAQKWQSLLNSALLLSYLYFD